MDQWTDGPTDPLIEVLGSTLKFLITDEISEMDFKIPSKDRLCIFCKIIEISQHTILLESINACLQWHDYP